MGKTCIVLFLFVLGLANAQDTIRLKHTNYTTVYSKSLRYPVLVEWWETKERLGCPNPLKRKDDFKPDPLLPKETDIAKDYVGSGYDRGHMCPAASNLCGGNKVQSECFYFSNMAPQLHRLNAGDWKVLEMKTREIAIANDSVHVWCGNIGEIKKVDRISIPKICWKVVYIKKTDTWTAYIFNNDNSKPDGIENNIVPLEAVEKLIGYKFRK
jgi:endonuclease G